MKKTLLRSVLVCGLLLSTTTLQAKSDTKTLVEKQIKENKEAFKEAPKEIVTAFKSVAAAMKALEKKQTAEAKKALKTATENFNKALKNNPDLDIVPLEENIEVFETTASSKEINDILTLTQELLVHYKLEEARVALEPLKDEMEIETISIPMKLFPLATQKALDALNKNETEKAKEAILEAYNTVLIEEALIPLPLLKAEDLIEEASLLGKADKETAQNLLDAAKEELERAKVLGYTTRHTKEYKVLNDAIDLVKKEIKGKNAVVKLYDKLKDSVSSLIDKVKNEFHEKEDDEKEVAKG
ncbi:MAG TPA: YfdX family protein [Campylobacterales bacterium]|nr:YfdX family protein [Campylobacterales bacterium]